MNQIYLLGIGHNTPVFIDLAESCGFKVSGLYHYNNDKNGNYFHGFKVLGSFQTLFSKEDLSGIDFLLTMGDNTIRHEISAKIRRCGGNTPSFVHPTAVISRFAKIETGVVINPFTYIQANSIIGKDTIILSGVNVSHDTTIGEACFLAGGSTIGAYTKVGDFVFIGQGAMTISEKVEDIGSHAFIGAGSLVTKSVGPHKVVAGRPAKVISLSNNRTGR
jgi:sugar O-acyltransferase (sialic acid O-acetyltransferase NeuD family)